MLTNKEGAKVTAKNKAKLVLKDHIDKFILEDVEDFDDFSKGEVVKTKEQILKLRERIDKILTIK